MLPGHSYSPEELIRIAWKRRWLILVPFAAAAIGAVAVTASLPDKFRSETVILVVPQRVPEEYVRSTVTTRIEDRLSTIQQQILSRSRLERIILDLNLYPKQREKMVMEDVVALMRLDVEGPRIERGDGFRVGFVSTDARLAQQVTERLARLFIDENTRDREVQAEGTTQFLDAQLEDARQRLIEHEKKLEQYRRQYAGQLPSQVQTNLQAIEGAQLQLRGIADVASRDRELRRALEQQIADLEARVPTPILTSPAADGKGGGTTLQQLETARATLKVLEGKYKPGHPDIGLAQREIATLEARLEAENRNRPTGAPPVDPAETLRVNRLTELRAELRNVQERLARQQTEEERLQGLAAQLQANVNAAPTRESELVELTRDYTTLQNSYTGLRAKLEESKLAADLERRQVGEQFKILDQARVPERPFSPNRLRINLAVSFAGLMFGLALVGLREYLDSSLKTEKDVARLLQLPVLAIVPMMHSEREMQTRRRRKLLAAIGAVVVVVASASAYAVWKLQVF